jgi:SAM-dependent methyltransferase
MSHEGDVVGARAAYYERPPTNLRYLLQTRYSWMNRFIGPHDRGVEVGCGMGVGKDFIRSDEFLLTDLADHDFLDVPGVDAMQTPFESASLDFVVANNMIHHLASPMRFLDEMARVLKPGGRLLIQDINASLAMRAILRLMRHEGYSFAPDVFDPGVICTDPDDLWSANCAISNLLFDDRARFEQQVPAFRIVYHRFSEFLLFANSGGVTAKTFFIPLPERMLRVVGRIDDLLASTLPEIFALQRRVVLVRDGAGLRA